MEPLIDQTGFRFEEKEHKYFVQDVELESVTTIVNRLWKKPFDQAHWAQKESEKTGETVVEVIERWSAKSAKAMSLGTEIHNAIEEKLTTGKPIALVHDESLGRLAQFEQYWHNDLVDVKVLGVESRVYWLQWRIAGTIDAVVQYKDKTYILDWKTNEKLETKHGFNMLPKPFDAYIENDLNLYAIQLSFYKAILKNWGINVAKLYIVHIGPNGLQSFKCPDLSYTIANYMQSNRGVALSSIPV